MYVLINVSVGEGDFISKVLFFLFCPLTAEN